MSKQSKKPSTGKEKPNQPLVSAPGTSRGPSVSEDVFIAPETPKNKNKASEATTTPSSRAFGTGTPDVAKARVDLETSRMNGLAGSRCLLENTTSKENRVEYAHCLPRATNDAILYNLEYSWGLHARKLNVDSRYNICRLSVKFHKLFDEGRWILLPEEDIVTTYLNSLPQPVSKTSSQPQGSPDIHDPPYRYTLVAHPAMGAVPFLRQKKDSIVKETNENRDSVLFLKDFDYLSFPFSGVEKIVPHVHPRFIICEIGLIMTKNITFRGLKKPASFEYLNTEYSKTIVDIMEIYDSWCTLHADHHKFGIPDAVQYKETGRWRVDKEDNSITKTASVRVASGAPPTKRHRSDADSNDS